MTSKSHRFGSVAAGLGQALRGWEPILRYRIFIIAAGILSGCAHDVTMEDPHTGKTEICTESLQGLNPWSQATACVASHVAQGWIRAGQE